MADSLGYQEALFALEVGSQKNVVDQLDVLAVESDRVDLIRVKAKLYRSNLCLIRHMVSIPRNRGYENPYYLVLACRLSNRVIRIVVGVVMGVAILVRVVLVARASTCVLRPVLVKRVVALLTEFAL